jgi:hypothetical protein
MQQEEKQGDFLSLTAAAVLVYNQATGDITDDPGLLQEVARCIARHAQLHGKSQYSEEVRPIPEAALRTSTFEDAAHHLLAPNGACHYRDSQHRISRFPKNPPHPRGALQVSRDAGNVEPSKRRPLVVVVDGGGW